MMHRKRIRLSAFILAFLVCSSTAMAESSWQENVTSDQYAVRATSRIVNGVLNVALGWTQLIVRPVQSYSNPNENIYTGLVQGVGGTLYYTGLGVYDLVTFWMPGKKGQELAVADCVTTTFTDQGKVVKAMKDDAAMT